MTFELQPAMRGQHVELRPLTEMDFEPLFAAASDPLVWEQHPQSDRYKKEVFQKYFDGAIQSGGAFAILDTRTQNVIGSSRYYNFNPEKNQIAIGYTFLTRPYWGGQYNGELKSLMLKHAFRFVDTVIFEIGDTNMRSQGAIKKIGAKLVGKNTLDGRNHLVYAIQKS